MTGEKISNLTDEQINVMVTKCAHDADWCTKYDSENKWIYEDDSDQGVANGIKVANYCNDPAVMWPIIVKAGISIIKHEDYNAFAAFVAAEIDDAENDIWMMADHRADDINPLRAAAIVYLKIKGVL